MRAWDIILFFTLCINLALTFCAVTNVFGTDQFGASQNKYPTGDPQYSYKNLSDINNFNDTMGNSVTSYVTAGAMGAVGIGFITNALLSIVLVEPTMERIFGLPRELAFLFQTIIWIIFIIGIIGWITGRHPDNAN